MTWFDAGGTPGWQIPLGFLAAYLMGAVPYGIIIAKCYGLDVRSKGSGNTGMTNVMRVVGKLPGILTLIGDAGKGYLVVLAVLHWRPQAYWVVIVAAATVIFGHTRSIFLKGKGGKGVATNFGVWIALLPQVFLVTGVTWLVVYLIGKKSSLAALCSLTVLPLAAFVFSDDQLTIGFAALVSMYITILHRQNIKRLLRGEELGV